MDTLRMTNYIIAVVFFVCYTYQFLYIPVPWLLAKRKAAKAAALEATPHNYAVLICARNESAVIADLIGSLRSQTYDQSLLHIFVLADNCTDDTSDIARSAGATVYERFNNVQVGKGYALQTLLGHLEQDYPAGFDGYFVFDADNILDPDYIAAMNRTFSQGHDIVTSYRNSKNYGDNWISAGYALWFLRESRYLNHARSLLGTSCAVSGTGFLFSRAVLEETGPWPFHLLTEDIQFSVHEILQGRKVAFAPDAVLYDEQPTTFRQSWRQRMRWSQGYLQVFRDYGARLLRGIFRGSFSCFDMSMAIMPAFVLSTVSILVNLTLGVVGALAGDNLLVAFESVGQMLLNMYLTLLVLGGITTITEWKNIRTSASPSGSPLSTVSPQRTCEAVTGRNFFPSDIRCGGLSARRTLSSYLKKESFSMYRILVCDGEKEIVSSLTACLTAEGYQVVTARTGWEVLNILSKQHIHLALLGTKLPGLDGLTTVTRLRQMHDLPVILLTSGTDSTENILGLTIGADDYITKPFQQAELLVRIRCHLRRYLHLSPPSPAALKVGGITLDDDARAVTVNDKPVSLTPLEYDILKFLMQHPCKVFSPQEIYRQVWREPPAAENSVAVHIRHIREKIEVDPSNPRYVTVVWGKGYKIEAGV